MSKKIPVRLNNEQKQFMIIDYQSGMAIKDIANKYNVNTDYPGILIKKSNILSRQDKAVLDKKNYNKFFSSKNLKQIKENIIYDINNNITLLEIIKKYNINNLIYDKISYDNDVQKRAIANKNKNIKLFSSEKLEELKILYVEKKYTVRDLSNHFNVTTYLIYTILKNLNIDTSISAKRGYKNKLSSEEENLIIKRYLNKENLTTIRKEYSISESFFYDLLESKNIIPYKKFSGFQAISESGRENIIELYEKGESSTNLSKKYNMSQRCMVAYLKRSGVDTSRDTRAVLRRKFDTQDHYFDNIDTEEKAYFLGLLFADGTNDKRGWQISIGLQAQDKNILEKFSMVLLKEIHLFFNEKKNENCSDQYTLSVCSKHLNKTLRNHGMVPNKSLILKFPKIILNSNDEIKRHFIRGFFDGDGTLSIGKEHNEFRFGLTTTNDFLIEAEKIINTGINFNYKYIYVNDGIEGNTVTKTMSTGGNRKVATILDWLYKDATLYLERKYTRYLKLKEHIEIVDNKYPHIKEKFERDYQKIDPTR